MKQMERESAYLIKSSNSATAITTFALRCKYLLDCAIRSWLAMQQDVLRYLRLIVFLDPALVLFSPVFPLLLISLT